MKDKTGNTVSFREYYEANAASLILFAKRFVPSEIAEDIIHDIFLELWNQLEGKEIPARSYLFMAVRNRCLNHLKRKQVNENYIHSSQLDNQILGLDYYYDTPEKMVIEEEDRQIIYDQIKRLPEKCGVIFKMAYLEDKKNADIAIELNLSIRTVEHQLYLGLKTLREKLAKHPSAPPPSHK